MDIEKVRDYGLSLPFATERCPVYPRLIGLNAEWKGILFGSLKGQYE